MQSYGQQAASRRPNVLFAKTPELIRTYHPLAKLVVVGLLAIGVSGTLCGLIGWGFGRNAVAGDTLSANLSPARCAQLLRVEPSTTDCHYAELLDHTDEVVGSRLVTIPLALVFGVGYLFARRRWLRDAKESEAVRRLSLVLGFGAFGLAAVILLSVALRNAVIDGDTAGLGRWLADGLVAAGVCLIYGVLALRQIRRPSAT